MTYTAEATVQIVEHNKTTSTLRVHEANPLDHTLPRCGTVPRPWGGIQMVGRPQGRGTVTCKRCAGGAR